MTRDRLRRSLDVTGLTESASRYKKAAKVINRLASGTILEVGSADNGIAPLLKREHRLVYSDILKTFGRGTAAHLVRGEISRLPFKSNIFPGVVCLDVMEHTPPAIRARAIQELYRVTAYGGKLVISSPVGEAAAAADRWLDNQLKAAGMDSHRWVAEHIENGVPEASDYKAWFDELSPTPASITVEDDLSVRAWQHALEAAVLPGSRFGRVAALGGFAAARLLPQRDELVYRQFYTVSK